MKRSTVSVAVFLKWSESTVKSVAVFVCLIVLAPLANAGPISGLYLANADSVDRGLYVVQGSSINRSWDLSRTEFALAVNETVRILQLNSLQGPAGRYPQSRNLGGRHHPGRGTLLP